MILRTDWHSYGYVYLVNLFKLFQLIMYIKKKSEIMIWIRIYNRIIHEILITFCRIMFRMIVCVQHLWFTWVRAMTAPVKDDSCQSDSYLDVQSKDNVVLR